MVIRACGWYLTRVRWLPPCEVGQGHHGLTDVRDAFGRVESALAGTIAKSGRSEPGPAARTVASKISEARVKGYEGESCNNCNNFTLVRNGTCMKCDTCGETSGCS